MSERPYHLTVDLGPAAHGALEEMTSQTDLNKSEIVRMVIEMANLLGLVGHWDQLTQQISQQVIPSLGRSPSVKKQVLKSMTDAEKEVIAAWREAFNTTTKFYPPAAINCIRAAQKNGLSPADLVACMGVAPEDDYVQSMVIKGKVPQPHELLSDKLLARLVPLAENKKQEDVAMRKMSLEATVKPKAVAALREAGIEGESFATAWKIIQEATSERDVKAITKAAIENTLDELLGSDGDGEFGERSGEV